MLTQIIYEPHPVSRERKAELRAQGLKIVDAVLRPAGTGDDADGPPAATGNPSDGLKVPELKAALEAKGIAIPEGALKADLQALLDGAA